MPDSALSAKHERSLSRLFVALFALVLMGYPLLGALSAFATIESSDLSIALRVLTLGTSLLAIGYMIALIEPRRWCWFGFAYLALTVLCIMRLLYDSQTSVEAGDLLTRYLGIIVLPTLCLSTLLPEYNERRAAPVIAILGSLFSCTLLVAVFTGQQGLVETSELLGGRLSLDKLNPISIAQTCATTLIAIYPLLKKWSSISNYMKIVIIPGALAAFIVMVQTGSRGPLIGFAFAVLFILIVERRWIVSGVIVMIIAYLSLELVNSDLVAVQRFNNIGSDEATRERTQIISDSLDQIAANPMFGSYYVERISGFYPHNPFIHAALSLGFVGLVLVTVMTVMAFRQSVTRFQGGEILLPSLFIMNLTVAQVSGSIFEGQYWPILALLLANPHRSAASRQFRTELELLNAAGRRRLVHQQRAGELRPDFDRFESKGDSHRW